MLYDEVMGTRYRRLLAALEARGGGMCGADGCADDHGAMSLVTAAGGGLSVTPVSRTAFMCSEGGGPRVRLTLAKLQERLDMLGWEGGPEPGGPAQELRDAEARLVRALEAGRTAVHADLSGAALGDDVLFQLGLHAFFWLGWDMCLFLTLPGDGAAVLPSDSAHGHVLGIRMILGEPQMEADGVCAYRGLDARGMMAKADIYRYIKDGLECRRRPLPVWACKPPEGTLVADVLACPSAGRAIGGSFLTAEALDAMEQGRREALKVAAEEGRYCVTTPEEPFVARGPGGSLKVTDAMSLRLDGYDTKQLEQDAYRPFVPWMRLASYGHMEAEVTYTAYHIPLNVRRQMVLPDGTMADCNAPGAPHGTGDSVVLEREKSTGGAVSVRLVNGSEFVSIYAPAEEKDMARYREFAGDGEPDMDPPRPREDLFPSEAEAGALEHEVNELMGVPDRPEERPEVVLIEDLEKEIKEIQAGHEAAKEQKKEEAARKKSERAEKAGRGKAAGKKKAPGRGRDEAAPEKGGGR